MSWTAPAMLDALKERLDAWDDLRDVEVFTAPVTKLNKTSNIVFTRVTGEAEWAAIGRGSRKEEYTLEGLIHVVRKGATEAKAKEARDAAADIANALADAVRDLSSPDHLSELADEVDASQVTALSVIATNLDQGGAAGQSRWAQVDFDIQVQTRI